MTEAPPSSSFAQLNSPSVASAIARCADGMPDVDRLRDELKALKALQGELATFAAALFELECARKGDLDARSNMLDTADRLLTFWRDKSGDMLAAAHPALSQLWTGASALLISFEKKRLARALKACFEARTDAVLLEQAIADLTPAGDRRVEFATCLYHLELARLFVDSSRLQFARRIQLVQEAYLDPSAAKDLVGDDEGLAALWKDLVPYLDEFFEAQEQEEEKARKSAENLKPEVTDPNVQPLGEPLFSPAGSEAPAFNALVPGQPAAPPPPDEVEIIETRELTPAPGPLPEGFVMPPRPPPLSDPAVPAVPPPPPPLSDPAVAVVPPPPPRRESSDSEVEVIELDEAPAAPPSRSVRPVGRELDILTDYEPSTEAQAFWRHTEASLGLLPDPNAPRVGSRVLSADGRAERKKLNAWLDGLTGRFSDLEDARAMQCLLRLYMAAQVKEKTLFGQPNPKRKEALKTALALLSGDAAAGGRAAVWFELDGPETIEHLQTGLEVVADFVQFCARGKLDPLDAASIEQFMPG